MVVTLHPRRRRRSQRLRHHYRVQHLHIAAALPPRHHFSIDRRFQYSVITFLRPATTEYASIYVERTLWISCDDATADTADTLTHEWVHSCV